MRAEPRVHVVGLGGTVSMAAPEGVDAGVVPELSIEDLLDRTTRAVGGPQLSTQTYMQIPSGNLRISDMIGLVRALETRADSEPLDGIVVVQGTDTLEETSFLAELLYSADPPMVFTGAMRHASHPGADGGANLIDALTVAADPGTPPNGVFVVLNGEIHAPRWVQKGHTYSPSAFQSPTLGPVGWIAEGRSRIAVSVPPFLKLSVTDLLRDPPQVGIYRLGLGDSGQGLDQLAKAYPAGIVVEAYGVGHAPEWMVNTLAQLASTRPVVLTSRVGGGELLRETYGFSGSESDLLEHGLIWAGFLDGLKARLLLSIALAAEWSTDKIREGFAAVLD